MRSRRKSRFNDRADGDLRGGENFLDRVGQQVGCRVANDFQTVCVLGGDDGQAAVLVDHKAGVDHLPIHLAGQRRLGQASADGGSHLGHGDRGVVVALRTIGKRDLDHGNEGNR